MGINVAEANCQKLHDLVTCCLSEYLAHRRLFFRNVSQKPWTTIFVSVCFIHYRFSLSGDTAHIFSWGLQSSTDTAACVVLQLAELIMIASHMTGWPSDFSCFLNIPAAIMLSKDTANLWQSMIPYENLTTWNKRFMELTRSFSKLERLATRWICEK